MRLGAYTRHVGENGSRPQLSVVILHHGRPERLDECCDALRAGAGRLAIELVIVDNGPRLSSAPAGVGGGPVVWLRNPVNRGFAAAANQGLRRAGAPVVLFLNSDARVGLDAVSQLYHALDSDPSLAAIAARTESAGRCVREPTRSFLGPFTQAAGLLGLTDVRVFPLTNGAVTGDAAAATRAGGASSRPLHRGRWVEAAAFMVRRDLLRQLGGFDEGYFFYEEDEDLCWRMQRRGYRIDISTEATVEHAEGATASEAGDWTVTELYRGQTRFVRQRFGVTAAWAHRLSVSAALALRAASGRGREPLRAAMEGLWKPAVAESTTVG